MIEFGVIAPLVHTPKNVALGYDVGKISAGCLVYFCVCVCTCDQYDSRFADAFWNSSKQTLLRHLLNIMTSWALVVDVWYLPPQHKRVCISFILSRQSCVYS